MDSNHTADQFSSPLDDDFDLDGDLLREECGVFGIFNQKDAAALTALGLHALQHRGQEAAGIVSFDGKNFNAERRIGLVGDHFTKQSTIDRLTGHAAIGHVRYSTSGGSVLRNVQPLFADLATGGFAVCHNGNFTNGVCLREKLIADGSIFQSTSDSEVILHLLSKSRQPRFTERFVEAIRRLEGAYSLIAMTNKKLVGVRDPLGIRPLVLGKLNDSYVLASETVAFDIIGAKFIRDIKNGEMVIITDDGLESIFPFPRQPARPCIFEYIYFSRPDSILDGRSVYQVRKQMGRELAIELPVKADVVIPIPDSGVPAALGYSEQSGIPFELGIIRNHYVGRTFIEPTQQIRALGVKLKHNANKAVIEGKRVVLLDDSIVRGTTSVKLVEMMYEAGATEVHMRIASPPIRFPDFYGIDTPEREALLAATMTLEEMEKKIGVTSLAFISVDGIYRSVGYEGRNDAQPQFTDHCFTGDYPTPLTDQGQNEPSKQLSLLAEVG